MFAPRFTSASASGDVPVRRHHVQRRLAVFGEHRIRIGAMIQQPARAARRLRPVENRVERRRPVGGPWPVHVRAMSEQEIERGHVARAGGNRQRDAVARIGAGVEQRRCEAKRTDDEHGAPEDGPAHAVMQPGKAQVRIRAKRDEAGARSRRGLLPASSGARRPSV